MFLDYIGLGNMKIGKWVIVDVKKLEHIIAELETTRKWIFWYWWGEEWLDCEDVVDNIGLSLPVIIRELKKSQRKKIAGIKRRARLGRAFVKSQKTASQSLYTRIAFVILSGRKPRHLGETHA
jgi:hypothetical protein